MLLNHKFFHWLYYQQHQRHAFNIGLGFFIGFFLALAQPFGIYNNNFSDNVQMTLVLFSFGIVWPFLSYVTDYLANKLFAQKAKKDYVFDCRVSILKLFLMIHAYFLIRSGLCNWACVDIQEYMELWFACSFMFLIVYVPFSLYARYRFFHKLVGIDKNDVEDLFELKGTGKESVVVDLSNVLYIKSDDNYADIVTFGHDGSLKTHVLRGTLRSLEGQLAGQSQFIRVHRSYIVNLQYSILMDRKDSIIVKKAGLEFEMPVSNKYQSALQRLIR